MGNVGGFYGISVLYLQYTPVIQRLVPSCMVDGNVGGVSGISLYCIVFTVQWNPSNPDTLGPIKSVLVSEVS